MQPTPPPLLAALPFLGLLLSIAILPAAAPRFWLRRMGWVAAGWSALLLPLLGFGVAGAMGWHTLIADYLPFIALLGALYTASGGILLRGGPGCSPTGNTLLLAMGMVLGLVMGPTGAAMVTIQPLLRANAHRRRKVHLVLFLIVVVANASGALTPLGNPPLFVGLLRGVPFFWPLRHLLAPYLVFTVLVLGLFWLIDRRFAAAEAPAPPREPLRVRGWGNAGLIAVLAASTVLQGPSEMGRLIGVAVALAAIAVSLTITPRTVRRANDFTWHPMIEVAILFAGLFVTLAPVSALLRAGPDGPLGTLFALTTDAAGAPRIWAYFWLCGLLSAFLDNAPAYMVFFDLAGIRPGSMTAVQEAALRAISLGAVLFGGLTYIGNAPNLMLRAVAAHRGVRMPGFFGFLMLASALLLPIFGGLTVLFRM